MVGGAGVVVVAGSCLVVVDGSCLVVVGRVGVVDVVVWARVVVVV